MYHVMALIFLIKRGKGNSTERVLNIKLFLAYKMIDDSFDKEQKILYLTFQTDRGLRTFVFFVDP